MSHMVIFRTPEGKPGYQPAETVHDAVAVVERLRNEEAIENVRIFRLEEVQFELRPYFKVELAGAGADESDDADAESAPPAIFGASVSEEATAEVVEHSEDEPEVADDAGDDASDEPAEITNEVPPPPSVSQPPWAAPPPPPPSPMQPPGTEAGTTDDELSGAGQRRGLFGR